ncbi:MAG: DMT family transporter [Hyphomicrobiales bacterium]
MKEKLVRADLLLFVTALIWGLAFVAQRLGMQHIGPFLFNGIRFLLGGVSLLPLLFFLKVDRKDVKNKSNISLLKGGVIAGVFLFVAASLQQIGIIYTTAGNAGFITSLYVILVPLFSYILWKKNVGIHVWSGAILATIGLYLLSGNADMKLAWGDLLVLLSAIFWAGHVLIIGWLSPKLDNLRLAIIQFFICGILSMIVAVFRETIDYNSILLAGIPILYGGIGSVGIAYTLQVFAQKHTRPSHAAIILSFESVFAAIGGWLIINEQLSNMGILGCVMMLIGVIIAQIKFRNRKKILS